MAKDSTDIARQRPFTCPKRPKQDPNDYPTGRTFSLSRRGFLVEAP